MLLSLALVLVLPADLGAVSSAPAGEPEQPAVDEPTVDASCVALFGDEGDKEARRASREARLFEVSRSERLLDVTHSDPLWRTPTSIRIPGLDVVGLAEGPEGKTFARVRLSEAWSETCAAGEYLVGPDDGLGADGLVLALLDEGVLAEHKGHLVFLPKAGATPPHFRLIWRSAFGLNVEPGKNGSVGGNKAPAAKNPRATSRQDPQQQKKAAAKAAAEKRRNMATRPVRPRG